MRNSFAAVLVIIVFAALLVSPSAARAEHEGKIQILLPGWTGDRHPNLAGYNVIADETAKYLAKLLREKKAAK